MPPSQTIVSTSRDTRQAQLDALLDRSARARDRDIEEARSTADQALLLARTLNDPSAEARAMAAVAWVLLLTSHYPEARGHAESALQGFRTLGDRLREAETLNLLGTINYRAVNAAAALSCHIRAVEIARDIGSAGCEATGLNGMANVRRFLAEYDLALQLHHQALAIAVEYGSHAAEMDALLGIGGTLSRLARFDEAIEHDTRALARAEERGDLRTQAVAWGDIGSFLERRGETNVALEYTRRSLELQDRLGDQRAVGICCNNIGIGLRQLGDYAGALESLLRSLEIAEEVGDSQGELIALNNIGYTYELLGDFAHVLAPYQRSLQIAQEIGDPQSEAYAMDSIGRFHHRVGDFQIALVFHLRSLRLNEQTGDRYGVRFALGSIGTLLRDMGDAVKAEEYIQRSYDLATEMNDGFGRTGMLLELGVGRQLQGDAAGAIEFLESARDLAVAIDANDLYLRVLNRLAELYAASGSARRLADCRRKIELTTGRLFSEESARRTRGLMIAFEQSRLLRQTSELGLDARDMVDFAALLDRRPAGADAPDGIQAAPALASAGAPAGDTGPDSKRTGVVPPPPSISVVTFGELRVTVDGRTISSDEWKRKRPRDLFKLLLIHHRTPLTLDEIIETLWGSEVDRNMELLVMNAVSHIRRVLQPGRPARDRDSYLRSLDRSYLLDLGDDASIDFIRFKESIVAARRERSAGERSRYYEDAISLYSGDFLKEDIGTDWTESERSLLKDAFLEALEFLAAEHLRSGRLDQAIGASRRVLAYDSTSERAHEILIESLIAVGRPGEARAALDLCIQTYQRELGVDPPRRLRDLLTPQP